MNFFKKIWKALVKIWVILDVEGPQVLNDNAQETTVALAKRLEEKDPRFWQRIASEITIVPSEKEKGMTLGEIIGTRLFRFMSGIDDIWGDYHCVPKDPSYSSGHTLKVILPFFRAMGADYKWLYEFARSSIRAVPDIREVLASLDEKYNVRMVSTSYEFFVRAFCDLVGFDFKKAYCTQVPRFDEIGISEYEAMKLLVLMKRVASMPVIDYNKETGEVVAEHRANYEEVIQFLWETVYAMPVGKLLRIVHPVGQTQKRETLQKIRRRFLVPKKRMMYVGDSQTDVQVVEELAADGLTVMFNGKGRVCSLSNIMYIGEGAGAIKEVADLFAERGRQGVIDYYTPPRKARCGGKLAAVTPKNAKALEEESVDKRKKFRGVHIGELT